MVWMFSSSYLSDCAPDDSSCHSSGRTAHHHHTHQSHTMSVTVIIFPVICNFWESSSSFFFSLKKKFSPLHHHLLFSPWKSSFSLLNTHNSRDKLVQFTAFICLFGNGENRFSCCLLQQKFFPFRLYDLEEEEEFLQVGKRDSSHVMRNRFPLSCLRNFNVRPYGRHLW